RYWSSDLEMTGSCEYVFANGHGLLPVTTNYFNKTLKKFCNLAGIKSTSKREKPSQPRLSKGILTVHTDPPP
ncbi:MAG: hypothetical protein IKS67_08610, partial [Victivallales bacterium]|nr:hypothetical protein [Victivallales bacterium]